MLITFISMIFTDIIVYFIAYDGRVLQTMWLVKFSLLSLLFSIAGITEERKKDSKIVKWYWISAILMTLLGLSKL